MAKKYITAKFDSECYETGKQIKKGDRVIYDERTRRVYASGSPTQQEFIKQRKKATGKERKPKDQYYNWQNYNDR